MGTVFLGVGVYIIISHRDLYDRLGKTLPQALPPSAVMLLFVFSVPPLCGITGAFGGLLYHLAEDSSPDGGIGSSNLIFTSSVLGIAALAFILIALIRKAALKYCLPVIIAFAVIFGWILPLLGNWR